MLDMTKKTKKILFLILGLLFLITSSLVVFYSFGWRFNWKTKKITKTGLFYFKALPKNSQIYLNGELKKKTDFFFGSALIDNLLPGKYEIEIKKEGYFAWKKTLEIKEKQATEAKNIILTPQNPKFAEISEKTENVFFSPDNKKIILEEVSNADQNQISDKENWALKLFEPNKNLKSGLINQRDISQEENRLLGLKFSPDSKRVLLKIKFIPPSRRNLSNKNQNLIKKEDIVYYLLEIDKSPAVLTPLKFLKANTEKIFFNPQDQEKLFVLSRSTLTNLKETAQSQISQINKELSEINLKGGKTGLPSLKNIIDCSISNSRIYCLDNAGFLLKTNLSFGGEEKLNSAPLSFQGEKYKIIGLNHEAVLQEEKTLYWLKKNKSVQKISDSAGGFKLSPDSKKLAFFNNYEIWILFLEKKYDQPPKEKGEKLFLTRFSEKIDKLFWLTNNYLIFNSGNKIKIAEIDDRDKINIIEIARFQNPKIYWNKNNNKLYVLSAKKLYASQTLIP
jgi:hypothetical protein